MKPRIRQLMITLGVLALGVFVSCSSKNPEDEYPQDRWVGGPNLVKAHMDPAWLSSHPDSSGWRIDWTLPATTEGIVAIYVLADSVDPEHDGRFGNGSNDLDPASLPGSAVKLGVSDTSWSIPSSYFKGAQGKKLRTDTTYTFSVWVRYQNGPTGSAPRCKLFLGDKIPPLKPFVFDSAGQTEALLRFARPRDQANLFDTSLEGVVKSVRAIWWEGSSPADSTGKVHSTRVPQSELEDKSKDTFELRLAPMKYWTRYCYVLEVVDTSGNVAPLDVYQITTRDSLAPAGASDLADRILSSDSVSFSWAPATDTSGPDGSPLRAKRPNYHIRRYVVRLNGIGVDSADLSPSDSAQFGPDSNWTQPSLPGRFSWDGSRWSWYWRDFRPGKAWTMEVVAYDWSGNRSSQIPSKRDSVALPAGLAGRCDSGWVPVGGDPAAGLSNYCIEEHEHAVGGKVVTRVTWSEALQACSDIQAQLCSDAQWERACMTFPGDTVAIATYGAVGAGEGSTDTFTWLQTHCQLGTGDSVAFRNLANTDPRCVSGWGVYDMPGRVGEWTRDVYRSNYAGRSNLEPGTLAYLGPSDLTNQPDLGTIHGGSALVLDQSDRTLASARCQTRNYPASNVVDTLRDSAGNLLAKIQHPLPTGISSAWGFRCCKRIP